MRLLHLWHFKLKLRSAWAHAGGGWIKLQEWCAHRIRRLRLAACLTRDEWLVCPGVTVGIRKWAHAIVTELFKAHCVHREAQATVRPHHQLFHPKELDWLRGDNTIGLLFCVPLPVVDGVHFCRRHPSLIWHERNQISHLSISKHQLPHCLYDSITADW